MCASPVSIYVKVRYTGGMNAIKKFLKILGPGFITGVSDDDPSGIATYAQTGAQFGYTQLWTVPFLLPLTAVIQEMCGRIGMVTGKGLSGIIKTHYNPLILHIAVFLVLIANIINIGTDLGAMASSAQLLLGIPFIYWLLGFTALTLGLEIFLSYHVYSKYIKYLTLSLFTYVVVVFVVKQDWGHILHDTVVPSFSLTQDYLMNLVALLGTTISPYLFFWQASEEVEEEVESHQLEEMGSGIPTIQPIDINTMRLDTIIGTLFAHAIMFFIMVTTASTLNTHGLYHIDTATEAAEALRPLGGELATWLFAAGIIGTGLLGIPILAGSASYALSEALSWREGLYLKFNQAHGFYGIIIVATLSGIFINFTGIPPFKLLYYSAVINGLCAPPLMLLVLLISNNKRIMGPYTNTRASNLMGGLITLIMGGCAVALLLTLKQPS